MISAFTAEEKRNEILREIKMRHEVYGRNAPGGVLRPEQQRRIAIMVEIADDYWILASKERLL